MVSRRNCRYRVEYGGSFLGEQKTVQGVILDLSLEGGRARSSEEFNKGEFLRVLIDAPRYEKPLHVTLAVVRWSKEKEFGMEFIQMEPDDQQRFRQLIRETAAAAALSTQDGFR
ncbi:MAG TPA: PilZ domain-containing protein [Nitrospira sp.]|nr:PilZ domain-containing protein [Nitrospira sp.]